jgi:S1-C subfamily serine protease
LARSSTWAFPTELQPSAAETRFDLAAALDAVVLLRTRIPEDAFTAEVLGTERVGNGVVTREDGLIVTIGYLVTEASTIWITTNRGEVVPGTALAVDPNTGFGLVQPLGRMAAHPIRRGSSASAYVGENVIVAGHGGRAHALKASLFARREFAGYWEYVLDEALFTVPAHPQWGGAALISGKGELLGIGSLLVQEKVDSSAVQGNMLVPIDLLEPILEDLLTLGRANRPPRPWLGLYAAEVESHLAVAGLATQGPAARAGMKVGDLLLEVAGERATGLADLFRKVWQLGAAGVEVPIGYSRDGRRGEARVRSADRADFLKKPMLQ